MFATTRDGTRIAYAILGDAKATKKVALLHSLAMDRAFWTPVAEKLATDAAVLVIDCRGHGLSDKPQGPYTVEQFADDLADVMDSIGWRQATIGGCSMGGCVTLAFAIRHPDRVKSLGLFDTTAFYNDLAAWEDRANKGVSGGLAVLIPFQKTRWFSDKFNAEHPDIVQSCVDVFVANEPHAYHASCLMLGHADLRAGLASIDKPTRIAVGEEDYATPLPMAQEMHAGIKGSTLKVIPSARHLSPVEVPDVIAGLLREVM
ncbi:MAG: putative lactone hydrolase [Hyphomicrobiales bacterium]|nr:putative lactone hydrolase [Hyphomicrobiales bacterium]